MLVLTAKVQPGPRAWMQLTLLEVQLGTKGTSYRREVGFAGKGALGFILWSLFFYSLHDAPAGSHIPLQLSTGWKPALPGPGTHCHDGPRWPRRQHDGAAAHGALPTLPAR